MTNNLDDLLKEHFATKELPRSKVQEILGECEIARSAYRWRLRAIGASSVAAAALLMLTFIWASPDPEPPAPEVRIVEVPTAAPPADKLVKHKLVAVMIHSPNCPNSKAMDPVFAELQEQFVDESVLFIKFDYSSDCARHQAELLSKNLGLEIIYEQYRRTGEIILVSASGNVREVVDRGQTIADASSTLRETLKKSSM